MYSTTTIAKHSKFTGRLIGTHQQLDLAARRILGKNLPIGKYFPSGREIIHFEGTRGPDGLKRKSPGIDEPNHMLVPDTPEPESESDHRSKNHRQKSSPTQHSPQPTDLPASAEGHERLDERSVLTMILDHHWNLTKALEGKDHVRAAFEAAWMAHMITDGLTPAHHFPLDDVKDVLMTDKELVHFLGAPIKGIMHGRSFLETMRNNWLYWGAKGHMNQHLAYEYGVLLITATSPSSQWLPHLTKADFEHLANPETIFKTSLDKIQALNMYETFRTEGWTTNLAFATRDFLLPEIVRCIVLCWYSAAQKAYKL